MERFILEYWEKKEVLFGSEDTARGAREKLCKEDNWKNEKYKDLYITRVDSVETN